MSTIEKNTSQIENNKYTLDLVNSWIGNVDAKINISCGISSLVIAAIGIVAGNVLIQMAQGADLNEAIMVWFYITLAVFFVAFLTSLWFYFWALNPNLTSGKSKIEKAKYGIFYKDINEFTNVDDYIEAAEKATEDEFNKEVLREVYINSGICTRKMKRFKIGMWLSVVAILAAVLACALFYFAIIC